MNFSKLCSARILIGTLFLLLWLYVEISDLLIINQLFIFEIIFSQDKLESSTRSGHELGCYVHFDLFTCLIVDIQTPALFLLKDYNVRKAKTFLKRRYQWKSLKVVHHIRGASPSTTHMFRVVPTLYHNRQTAGGLQALMSKTSREAKFLSVYIGQVVSSVLVNEWHEST